MPPKKELHKQGSISFYVHTIEWILLWSTKQSEWFSWAVTCYISAFRRERIAWLQQTQRWVNFANLLLQTPESRYSVSLEFQKANAQTKDPCWLQFSCHVSLECVKVLTMLTGMSRERWNPNSSRRPYHICRANAAAGRLRFCPHSTAVLNAIPNWDTTCIVLVCGLHVCESSSPKNSDN